MNKSKISLFLATALVSTNILEVPIAIASESPLEETSDIVSINDETIEETTPDNTKPEASDSESNVKTGSERAIEDNWLTREVANQAGKVNVQDLTDADFASVRNIVLAGQNLSGEIPDEISRLTNVSYINISNNKLTGSIPESIGSLTTLRNLYIFNNDLSGPIPESIGNLINLKDFWANLNNLEGEIPDSIGNLKNIATIYLDSNNLVGKIPDSVGNLPLLTRFNASVNNLSGNIPSTLGNLPNLQYLVLNKNNLSGAIPPELSGCSLLNELNLSENSLTGEIPSNLKDLTNLTLLNISLNNLIGVVPAEIKSMPINMSFENNLLEGESTQRQLIFENTTPLELLIGDTLNASDILSRVKLRSSSGNKTPVSSEYNVELLLDNEFISSAGEVLKEGTTIIGARIIEGSSSNHYTKTSSDISVTILDPNKVEIFATPSTTDLVKGSMDINISATSMQGIARIDCNGSTISTNSSTTFTATENREYVFTAYDSKGNSKSTSIVVSNIDNTAPTLLLNIKDTAVTNSSVVIQGNVSDDNSIKKTILPDGTETTNSSFEYTVTDNGDYSFVSIDSVGNETSKTITIGNIDKIAPNMLLDLSETDIVNEDIFINIEVSDNTLISKTVLPDGTETTDTLISYRVSANGNYEFTTFDIAGNHTTKSIVVDNIDKIAPELTLTANTLDPTNQDISIAIYATDNTAIKNITLPDGSQITESSSAYIVSGNGSYTFTAEDIAGNIATKTIVIDNIDKIAPTINTSLSSSESTNKEITIDVNVSDNVAIRETILPDGTKTNDSSFSYEIGANGIYEFVTFDTAGNSSSSIVSVTNIDKVAPIITAIVSNTSPTNEDVDIAINVSDDTGIFETILPDGSKSKELGFIYKVSSNGVYTFETSDLASNKSSLDVTINNIDKVNPSLAYTLNTEDWTNNPVSINVTADDNVEVSKIVLPDGAEVNSKNFTYIANENGDYNFTVYDTAGNSVTETVTVSNIDKTAPILTYKLSTEEWTNKDINILIEAVDNTSVSKIILPDGSETTLDAYTYVANSNGDYVFEAVDAAGNSSTITVTINNIDKELPTIVTTLDTFDVTNKDIVISGKVNDNVAVDKIILPDGSEIASLDFTYTVSFNGEYEFSVYDTSGNIAVHTVLVSNIDKTSPTYSYTLSTTNWSKGPIQINLSAYDSVAIKKIISPDGSESTLSDIAYTVSSNGVYNFEIYDTAGNKSIADISVSNIDNDAPKIDIELVGDNSLTNSSTIAKVSVSDDGSGVKETILPDSSSTSELNFDYEITNSGTYIFTASDNLGNTSTKEIVISNIDTTAPVIELVATPVAPTNRNVIINATVSDDFNIDKTVLPDGTETSDLSFVYEVSENGIYEFTAYDLAGNSTTKEINITNIDKIAPIISTTLSTNEMTNKDITISIAVSDNTLISKTVLPDGTENADPIFDYIVESNGEYEFTTYDIAGNSTVKKISISNIDKEAPKISLASTNTEPTNKNVPIKIKVSDNNSIEKTILPDGKESFNNEFTFIATRNGTYKFTVYDSAGNSTDKSIVIDNIDKIHPTITAVSDTVSPTNKDVSISVAVSDNVAVKKTLLPDGRETTDTSFTHTASENSEYEFTAEDSAGNTTSTKVTISNIDRTKPIIVAAVDTSVWSKDKVSITIDASDDFGVDKIILPDGTETTDTNFVYEVTDNGDYIFQAIDSAGNITSHTVTINNIDKVTPELELSANNTLPTNKDVTINIAASDNVGIQKIVLPDGTEINSDSGEYVVSSNGTYNFLAYDLAGNSVAKSISIDNIDMVAPSIIAIPSETEYTKEDVIISVTAADNTSVLKIVLPDGSESSNSSVDYTVSTNGNYTFIAYDAAGNSSSTTISVSNIDKQSPIVSVTPSTSEITNQNIKLIIEASDNIGVEKIILPDKTEVYGDNATYTVEANGEYIITVVDIVGNTFSKSIPIDNIDRIAPILDLKADTTTPTNKPITIAGVATDNTSLKNILLPNGSTTSESSFSFKAESNGKYLFIAEDIAGNRTEKEIDISNIDTTSPTVSLSISSTELTNKDVDITISASDTSGISRITLPDGSEVADNVTTYTATKNGDFKFTVYDKAGNKTEKIALIRNIDKEAPVVTTTLSNSEFTNNDIVIHGLATDNSGIEKIILPNGKETFDSNFKYTISENGQYTFKVYDIVGNYSEHTVNISNIDKTPATLDFELSATEWTNKDVVISLRASDNTIVDKIILPDLSEIKNDVAKYTITRNGEYTFSVIDAAGNITSKTIEVDNIDKEAPDINYNLEQSRNTPSLKLDVIIKNTPSGVKNILLNDEEIDIESEIILNKNGTYTITVIDNAGNTSQITFIVDSIPENNEEDGRVPSTPDTAPPADNKPPNNVAPPETLPDSSGNRGILLFLSGLSLTEGFRRIMKKDKNKKK